MRRTPWIWGWTGRWMWVGATQVTHAPLAVRATVPPVRAIGRVVLALGLVLSLWGGIALAKDAPAMLRANEPIDLDVNLVAAQRLVDREPVYDREASRPQAEELGGPAMAGGYTWALNSFTSPPSSALLHAPFLALPHGTGVATFRLLAFVGMVAAVWLAAGAVRPENRAACAAVGVGVLLSSFALGQTLQLGQGHEFVMLGLALGIWASARERWELAGVGFGLAAVLKVTPGLIVLYLALRGRWRAAGSAAATAIGLNLAAAAVGRPTDLVVWVRDVLPSLSQGTVRTINQSIPGLAARLTSGRVNLDANGPLGAWRHTGIALSLAAVAWLLHRARTLNLRGSHVGSTVRSSQARWGLGRNRAIDPLELGLLVLVGLVAGPLTWAHYATWAAVPAVLLADPDRWAAATRTWTPVKTGSAAVAAVVGILLLSRPVASPAVGAVRDAWSVRLTSSPTALGLALLTGVAVALLQLAAAGESSFSRNRSSTCSSASRVG